MLRTIFLGSMLVFLSIKSYAETEWELHTEKEGVSVYTRHVDGFDLKRVRAITKIDGQIKNIVSVLKDVKNYDLWLADCEKGSVVEELNDNENIAHLFFNVPWPISDRDVVFNRKFTYTEQGGVRLDFYALDNVVNDNSCCVRMTNANGFFEVYPSKDSSDITIIYEFVSDPGGNLPDWLTSYTITDAPLNTLLGLKERVGDI